MTPHSALAWLLSSLGWLRFAGAARSRRKVCGAVWGEREEKREEDAEEEAEACDLHRAQEQQNDGAHGLSEPWEYKFVGVDPRTFIPRTCISSWVVGENVFEVLGNGPGRR